MVKGLILRVFTYSICIVLIILSSWWIINMITYPKSIDNSILVVVGPFIFLAALTYLVTDIILIIKTFRKKKNNDNFK